MEAGDIMGMIGNGGGQGGASGAKKAVTIAAGVQDEIAAYLEPLLIRRELRDALRSARNETRTGYDEAMGYQQPYYDVGTENLKYLSDLYRSGKLNVDVPEWDDPALIRRMQTDPGYNFRLREGQNAIEGSAAARGGLLSSGTMKALQRYGSDLASLEYEKMYNRVLDNYKMKNQQAENMFNFGNQLAGYGERAGARLSDLRVGKGQSLADIAIQRGNVEAGMLHGLGNAAHLQAQDARSFVGGGPTGYQQQMGMGGGGGGGGSGGVGGDLSNVDWKGFKGFIDGFRNGGGGVGGSGGVDNIDTTSWGQNVGRG